MGGNLPSRWLYGFPDLPLESIFMLPKVSETEFERVRLSFCQNIWPWLWVISCGPRLCPRFQIIFYLKDFAGERRVTNMLRAEPMKSYINKYNLGYDIQSLCHEFIGLVCWVCIILQFICSWPLICMNVLMMQLKNHEVQNLRLRRHCIHNRQYSVLIAWLIKFMGFCMKLQLCCYVPTQILLFMSYSDFA